MVPNNSTQFIFKKTKGRRPPHETGIENLATDGNGREMMAMELRFEKELDIGEL